MENIRLYPPPPSLPSILTSVEIRRGKIHSRTRRVTCSTRYAILVRRTLQKIYCVRHCYYCSGISPRGRQTQFLQRQYSFRRIPVFLPLFCGSVVCSNHRNGARHGHVIVRTVKNGAPRIALTAFSRCPVSRDTATFSRRATPLSFGSFCKMQPPLFLPTRQRGVLTFRATHTPVVVGFYISDSRLILATRKLNALH